MAPVRAALPRAALALGLMALASLGGCGTSRPPAPTTHAAIAAFEVGDYLPGSHSHNDYDRDRPLFDALAHGFASVEVDVALLDGELYIVHDAKDARATSPRLVDTYLDPLRVIAGARGGRIYGPDRPPLQLLVDIKSDAGATHPILHELLAEYDDVLTRWTAEGSRTGAVTVVLSGERPIGALLAEPVRYAALDGRIYDRRTGMTVEEMPLVSINWDDTIGLLGSVARRERLERAREMIATVHGEGRRVRFWNTPDRDDAWRDLSDLGVDYIGTDGIAALHRFIGGSGGDVSRLDRPRDR